MFEFSAISPDAEADTAEVVVVSFDDVEEVYSHDLEHHAEVVAVGAAVDEGVEELDDAAVISIEFPFFLL